MKRYFTLKLIYPMGKLRNLSECLQETVLSQRIPDQANLVLVGQNSFTWNINAKGPSINLYNDNLTANKKNEAEYEAVLGTVPISSGVHYFEINIEKFLEQDDIIIGFVQKGVDIR